MCLFALNPEAVAIALFVSLPTFYTSPGCVDEMHLFPLPCRLVVEGGPWPIPLGDALAVPGRCGPRSPTS